MKHTIKLRSIWKNTAGQDLIEYALMTGFLAVAAGAALPNLTNSLSIIYSRVNSSLNYWVQ